jgi:hypothetical protein
MKKTMNGFDWFRLMEPVKLEEMPLLMKLIIEFNQFFSFSGKRKKRPLQT